MDVCLVDVDSRIPNLALMKLSAWHRDRGDTVKLGYSDGDHPDLCYASKMFDFTPEVALPDSCDVRKGGPGYSLEARIEIPDYDRVMPDYGLYSERYPHMDMAIGRFTRGCIRRCPWCVVPKMDGNVVHEVAGIDDFYAGQSVLRVLDDNILADGDIFCRACEQIRSKGKAIRRVIWEALDIRLITDETAKALRSLGGSYTIHFAWDGPAQDDAVPRGVEILGRNGIRPYRLMFYVLVGFNTSREYDMYRINTLREMGCQPYVMPFDKHGDPYQHYLARWCNNKFVFKKCKSFDDYEQWVKFQRGEIKFRAVEQIEPGGAS